jgi:hypothetical protein
LQQSSVRIDAGVKLAFSCKDASFKMLREDDEEDNFSSDFV